MLNHYAIVHACNNYLDLILITCHHGGWNTGAYRSSPRGAPEGVPLAPFAKSSCRCCPLWLASDLLSNDLLSLLSRPTAGLLSNGLSPLLSRPASDLPFRKLLL